MSTVPYTFANDTGNIPLSYLDVNFANVKAFADTAGYVTASDQANITSVGTLNSLGVSGNITGGNISTAGNITGGNITGGNITISNVIVTTLSATGNVIANNGMFTNIVNVASHTGGLVSITGNVTANNGMFTNIVNTTSFTGSVVSVSGNVTSGNIGTGGLISAAGNITVGSGGAIGVGTTTPDAELNILAYPQTVSYSLSGNSTTPGTDLHITGADGANTRITQDSFGTGSYVAFTGRTGRGTAAAPTQTQSGDTLTQFTARGFSNGTLQFGNISTGRVDIVAAEAFTDTSRATNVQIYTTATSSITPTAIATFSSAAGLSVAGNVTANNGIFTNIVNVASFTGGLVSVTGNVTANNGIFTTIVNVASHTGTIVSVTGNVTANNGIFTTIVNVASHTGSLVSVTGNVSSNNMSATGIVSLLTSTAGGNSAAVGGTAGVGLLMSNVASFGIFFGNGAPTITAARGSLYINTTASAISTRLYINTTGAAVWTAFTTAA